MRYTLDKTNREKCSINRRQKKNHSVFIPSHHPNNPQTFLASLSFILSSSASTISIH
jgi:hypothetical protein